MNLKNLSESLQGNNWDEVATSGMVTTKDIKPETVTTEQKPDSNTGKQNMFENKKLMFD